MPRRGSPYGPAYERERERILVPGSVCHMCRVRPATEADHQPPLTSHVHVNGTGCCRLLPACRQCNAEQGFGLGWGAGADVAPEVPDVPEPEDSPGPEDPRWEVPWLFDLLDVPQDATWPRYMTLPHPDATGSYGAAAIDWLSSHADLNLRWWQKLALTRQLEHDRHGDLVWLVVLPTTARQVGKSILLRAGATWRLHQSERFGEQQLIMHTGKDLPVCKEVQRLARLWARGLGGYTVREQNGSEEIAEPGGSRWLVRGKSSIYGYSVSNGLVDEAWGVDPGVVEDGLEPTMAERQSPQLVLASTAHSRSTPLFPAHRLAALSELETPDATLILEWSAHRDADIDDRDAWLKASPHWSKLRQRLLEQRVTRVRSGELQDEDETDPVESFRSQFLNIWPARGSSDAGTVLVDPDVWARRAGVLDTRDARVFVAVEDNHGRGAAVAAAAVGTDGRYELDGWLVESWADAFEDVTGFFATRERTQLVIGPALANEVDPGLPVRVASASDTRSGLALVRQLAGVGGVCHDEAPDLVQLTKVHVREQPGGMTLVPGSRADLVRAAAWALLAAHESVPEPSIA